MNVNENDARRAFVERRTNETEVSVRLCLDGKGEGHAETGIKFLDHMLDQTIKHGYLDAEVRAAGDITVDSHHTAEDVGITFGMAVAQALGDKAGSARYGHSVTPMDEALCLCALDFSGRPHLSFDYGFAVPKLGDLDAEMIREFFGAFSAHAGCCVHIRMLSGGNAHHVAESMFKAFGRALAEAVAIDSKTDGVRSTKGVL